MMRCCLFLLLLSACTQTPPLRVPVSLASPHISAPSTPADEAPGVISSPPVSPIVLGLLPQQGALPTPAVSGPIFSQPLPNVLPSSGVLPGFSNGGGGGALRPSPRLHPASISGMWY